MSAFRAVRMRYERLGREEEALERLRELPGEWPDTDVLPAIWEFEIGKLVDRNETSRAIEKVDAFGKKYPAKVQGLMRLVVGQVRGRIEDLRGDPDRTEDLRNYKLVFDRFAEELYRNAAAKNLPAAKMYPIEQMRAESLLAGGKPAAALELFEKCADYDAKLRSAKAKQIDEEIARWIERTERARGGVTAIDMLSKEYFDLLGKHGYDVEDFGEAVSVRTAVEFLHKATVSEQQRERSAVVIDELLAALAALGRALKRDLPMDAGNVRGLARAHRAMKNYKGDGALKRYSELVEGIDRSRYSALYWSVQLERCQCLLEAFQTDKEQLKRLSVLIRQLRLEDPAMGGLYDRFNTLELEVLRLKR